MRREHEALLVVSKQVRLEAVVGLEPALSHPDTALNEAFLWAKLGFDMLACDVPPHGRGVGAGLPHLPALVRD